MRRLRAKTHFRVWLAIVGSATLVLGATFVMLQQSARLSANDLPRALNQQIKAKLQAGASPADTVPATKINIDTDINSFITVTDNSRHVIASSALLDGQTPLPPEGVFAYTAKNGKDAVIWQPKDGVRSAIYVSAYGNSPDDGFLITGHSLKPFEERIMIYGLLALISWTAVLAWASFLLLTPATASKTKN